MTRREALERIMYGFGGTALVAGPLAYFIPSPIREPWRRALASLYRRRRERRRAQWRWIFGDAED